MPKASEAQPSSTRRRPATFAKRFQLRISDAELEVLERACAAVEADTGRRPSFSEAVREFIKDGGKRLAAAVEAADAVSPQQRERSLAAVEDLAEQMRLWQTEFRRIRNNANQFNDLVRGAHVAKKKGGQPQLSQLETTAASLREDLAALDRKLEQLGLATAGYPDQEA